MSDPCEPLPVGKLNMELLASVLERLSPDDASVVGPGIGRDVAVIDTGGDDYLLLKSDPITFATDEIGHYAVTVNVNDIATAGGTPKWLLATLLLPEAKTTPRLVHTIFEQIQRACEGDDIRLVGGHTEVTHGLERPIVCAALVGEVRKGRLVTNDGVQAGDDILLTKAIAVEGTSIIAREKREELLEAGFACEVIDECADMLYEPGISVLAEAQIACDAGDIHAMHDPTEGGVTTGLWEMAIAGNVGITARSEDIPVYANTERFCEQFGLDPLGLIASGSLLIATSPDASETVIEACEAAGIRCTRIARATDRSAGCRLVGPDGETELPRYEQDEIGKLF